MVKHARIKCYLLHKAHFPNEHELNMHHCMYQQIIPLAYLDKKMYLLSHFDKLISQFHLLIPTLCSDNRL